MESRGKKILMGCGVGCLMVIILIIAACTGFTMWLNRPGELLEPDLLIGSDTTGYASWTLRFEDPGTEEFVRAFFDALQDSSRRDSAGLPPVINNWLTGLEKRRNEQQLQEMFPVVAVWTLRPGPLPGEDLHLYSVSLERAGNRMVLVDWIFSMVFPRAEGLEVVTHGDENVYCANVDNKGRSFAFFIRGNDLFITSDVRTSTLAVDRLTEAGDTEPARYEMRELFDIVPGEEPLRAAVMNQDGALERIWRDINEDNPSTALPWDDILGVAISGRFLDSETLSVVLEFRCRDRALAASDAGLVADGLRASLERSEFEFDLEPAVHGEWIRIDVTGRNMITQLRKKIEESGARVNVR